VIISWVGLNKPLVNLINNVEELTSMRNMLVVPRSKRERNDAVRMKYDEGCERYGRVI
jgi:hypothetical protein